MGNVWVDEWNVTFRDELGTLREFLQWHPGKFAVHPVEGHATKFTVSLVDAKPPRDARAQAVAESTRRASPTRLESKAIFAIKQQLNHTESTGNVWILEWNTTFRDKLGTLREFIESHADKFCVHPVYGHDTKFTVSLVGAKRLRYRPKPQIEASETKAEALPEASESDSDGSAPEENLEARALREIKRQLKLPKSTGNVWIGEWNRTFRNELGTLREFLDSHPDKFAVHAVVGHDRKFTVRLLAK